MVVVVAAVVVAVTQIFRFLFRIEKNLRKVRGLCPYSCAFELYWNETKRERI